MSTSAWRVSNNTFESSAKRRLGRIAKTLSDNVDGYFFVS